MSFLDIFKRKEKRSISQEEAASILSMALQFGAAYIDESSKSISAVYRAVDLISDSVAVLPIKIRNKNASHTEDISTHPIHKAFNNSFLSQFQLMKMLMESLLMHGNGYMYIERAKDGTPARFRFLKHGQVTINYNENKQILWYRAESVPGKIEPNDMIHLRKSTNDGVTGSSILKYASNSIAIAKAADAQARKFFENGCNLSGIIKVQGTLSKQQRTDILNSWAQAYTNGSNGVACLPGNMDYQNISVNAVDSQLLESRTWNISEIGRFFGIHPYLLGDASVTPVGGVEGIQNMFMTFTLQPYLEMIEQEFKRKLLPDSDLIFSFDEHYILRLDKTAESNYYKNLLSCGVLCINECREMMNLSPIEGGERHILLYSDASKGDVNNIDNSDNSEPNQ